jgi:putative sporulation protein YtxC
VLIRMVLHTRRDAAALHTYLSHRLLEKVAVQLHDEVLEIRIESSERDKAKNELVEVLSDYILETYQEKWLDHILSEVFYYKEEADREQILDIVRAIFQGEKPELPNVHELPSRKQIIRDAISDLIEEPSSFSFQSLETFRLSSYYSCLIRYLELAIDEYKLQQEYAAFVDKLRRIVKSYRPMRSIIYVVDKKPFRLYDEHFKPIENVNSIRSFYPLLKQWGVEAEPSILLTLIGLAPLKVFVFTDRPDDGMMRTLQNVFEERVEFQTIEQAKRIDL